MVVKTETSLFSSRQKGGAVSVAHLPLSNASLMRLTSLCEPGTLNIPSWWRPDGHTHSHYVTHSYMPDSPYTGLRTHTQTSAFIYSFSLPKALSAWLIAISEKKKN